MSNVVIAIDGPAGAGKSTVSKRLAKELDFTYLDTGAMYRALALKAHRNGVSTLAGRELAKVLTTTTIDFEHGEPQRVILDGEDVTDAIRTLEVGELASKISTYTEVRQGLVSMQQELIKHENVVLEGRDTTTVVAPHATVKIYLTASLEERAKRRSAELDHPSFETVRSQILSRDHRDITREDSPLTVASDAILIESGGLSIDEVVQRIRTALAQ